MSTLTLEEMERYRRKMRSQLLFSLVLFFLLPAVGIPIMVRYQDDKVILYGTLIILIINFFRHIVMYFRIAGKYDDFFRKNVVSALIRQFDPDFKYEQGKKIDFDLIREAGLLRQFFDKGECTDFLKGEHQGTVFESHQIVLKSRDTKHSEGVHGDTVFTGLFLKIQSRKPVNSPIFVFPKHTGWAKKANAMFSLTPSEPVIEVSGNEEFKDKFTVYGNDSEEAYKVLTPEMQSTIFDISKNASNKYFFKLSFVEDHIYLMIDNYDDPYIVSLKKSIGDKAQLSAILKGLEKQLGFVKRLAGS
jgi:hypothetical protein